jgi:hypothetical protein
MNVQGGIVSEKEVIKEFQRRFPNEFEMVVQSVYIRQLEVRISELEGTNANELSESPATS